MKEKDRIQEKENLSRRRTVKGWVFKDLSEEEENEIRSFLAGGPVPKGYENIWNTCREQLCLPPIVEEGLIGKIKEAIRKVRKVENTTTDDNTVAAYREGMIDAFNLAIEMMEES